jgi:putative alpha-1,2-mannosidase
MVGGPAAFVAKLDQFFDGDHFDASNQPSFHIPWLYNYAGAAAKTQARVRELALANFSAEPDGLPGNDDAGAMSSWFVLAAVGMYPVNVGDTVVSLSAPLVDRATIHLHPYYYGGGSFVIETERKGNDAFYIQSATLNAAPLTKPSLTHAEMVAGGTLHYVLGPEPSGWGQPP